MHRPSAAATVFALCMLVLPGAISAQTRPSVDPKQPGPPPAIAEQIRAIGHVIDSAAVRKIYAATLAEQPTDGVKKTDTLRYGSDERNRLDLYEPAQRPARPMPVVLFVHGGGNVNGDTNSVPNLGYYFARHGVLAALATYRLAPKDHWPTGPEDMRALVRWAQANAAAHGGDPKRIFLIGHSAGGGYAAFYALSKRYQPRRGSGLAGVILISGNYDIELQEAGAKQFDDPVTASYFGSDARRYPAMSAVRNLDAARLPTLLIYAEYDPPRQQLMTGELFGGLCRRDKACPELMLALGHDHISETSSFNTSDESVSRRVLDFIQAH